MGAGPQGGPLCRGSCRYPSRMVFPGDVSHAQTAAPPHPRRRGRAGWRARVRGGRGAAAPGAVLDSRASRGERSRWFTILALGALAYMVVFTIVGYLAT